MPEGRQALARQAGGLGELPEGERASEDTRRATGLLLASARLRTGYRSERQHPPPSGRSLLAGRGVPRWAFGQVLRWRGAFRRGAALRLRRKRPRSQTPEAGGEAAHEVGGRAPERN